MADLRATDDDEVEDTEILTVTATGPGKVLIGTVEIMVVDNDTAAYTGPSDPNLVEGRTYELTVTADATASRDARFTIRPDRAAGEAGDDDFTLEPSSIVICSRSG